MDQEVLILPQDTLSLEVLQQLPPLKVCPQPSPSSSLSPLLLVKLQVMGESRGPPLPPSFVLRYLLVKLNSFLKYGSSELRPLVSQLSFFYNNLRSSPEHFPFRSCENDSGLMAQVLLTSGGYKLLGEWELQEVLSSTGMVTASLVHSYFTVHKFLKKNQQAVTLSLVSLYARTLPFEAVVHQEKNHRGEIEYAAAIYDLMHLDPDLPKPQLSMVQDAYSLRCTPHVHGVVYDCLQEIKEALMKDINKPLTPTVIIAGHKVRNLLLRSEKETLLLDGLILSLNEVTHMSFLRCQRLLNPHLTRNNISQSPYFETYGAVLSRASHHVVRGKLLSAPSNADTVIMDNYHHDVYLREGGFIPRLTEMLEGITELMVLETMEAVDVLADTYGKARLFRNQKMEQVYLQLQNGKDQGFLEWRKHIQAWVDQ